MRVAEGGKPGWHRERGVGLRCGARVAKSASTLSRYVDLTLLPLPGPAHSPRPSYPSPHPAPPFGFPPLTPVIQRVLCLLPAGQAGFEVGSSQRSLQRVAPLAQLPQPGPVLGHALDVVTNFWGR